jgi:hypothetical protein
MPVEMKIVALIARGDKYNDIKAAIKDEFDRNISMGVITAIRQRNEQSLGAIREVITQREKDDAAGLLSRSHRLIGKKLRDAETAEGGLESVKLSDLTAISREMFHQTRVEQGLGDDGEKLANPREKLKELQSILEENDTIRLERIVFAKREQTSEVHTPAHEDESARGRDNGDSLPGGDLHTPDNPDKAEVSSEADLETA